MLFVCIFIADTNSWSCGCTGRVFHVAKVIVVHPSATWVSSLASAEGAMSGCQDKDQTATLINSSIPASDLECLKAYRNELKSQFPNPTRDTTFDIWLANYNGKCARFSGKTDNVTTEDCDPKARARFICTRPINSSKYNNVIYSLEVYNTNYNLAPGSHLVWLYLVSRLLAHTFKRALQLQN